MLRPLVSSTCVLALTLLVACDEKPSSQPAAPSATAAATPAADAPKPELSAPPPAPTPAAEAAAPRPKKKLEECSKGPNVEFEQKEIEAEIRKKLPKPDGPITIADLAKLRSLNLSQVKLADLDPCVFSRMKSLKELFLGPGTYDDLSPISVATQLESLRASISQVKDLKPLEKLTLLDRLDLGRTQITDIKPLASLSKLSELQLDDTAVEDVTPLEKLTLLTTLSLKRTKVKDVSALKNLKKLKFLYTGGSPLDADPMSVAPVRANGTKVIAE
ncbi:MAG TPA: leucine-rich repeat domain-containing protein [Polyangiaceae bacterium]|jgi:internalin A|nr:leucine-rich repeat domain-containing protein [Polyangiaceae bacterium]